MMKPFLLILAYATGSEPHPVSGKLVLSAWATEAECQREMRGLDLNQLLPLARTARASILVMCAHISTQLRDHR